MLSNSNIILLNWLKFILLASIFIVPFESFSQSTTWYFGQNAGVSFNAGGVPTVIQNSNMNTPEGCACIMNSSGAIANYSNGHTLWDGKGVVIANDLDGSKNAIQSAIFLPKPQDKDTVYLFTIDADVGPNGLCYSTIVNQNIVSGMKNINIQHNVTERMCLIRHCNNQDAWLIVHSWGDNSFYAYKINGEGVDLTPVISNVGTAHNGNLLNATGYLKASRLGDRLALAKMGCGTVELFHFDDVTGVISNPIELNNMGAAYGVEFNESGSVIYVSTASGSLYNYSLASWNTTAIQSTRSLISNSNNLLGALQMGPNNKIYVARDNSYFLGRISSPDNLGISCNYDSDFLNLNGNKCEAGLPPFVRQSQDIIPYSSISCLGDSSYFDVLGDVLRIDSLIWNFGDLSTLSDFSKKMKSRYLYPNDGLYACSLYVYRCQVVDTFGLSTQVLDIPTIDLGLDTSICENMDYVLDASVVGGANYLWQNGSKNSSFTVSQIGKYWVRVQTVCGTVSDTIVVSNIWKTPAINLPNDTVLCKGDSLILDGGDGFVQYLWQNQDAGRYFIARDSGWYSLSITDSNHCDGNGQFYVDLDSLPTSRLGNDTSICINNYIVLYGGVADQYKWQDNYTGAYYSTNQSGDYSVQLRNQCGDVSDTISVIVDDCLVNIAIPNAFTPNSDFINDIFLPKAQNITDYEMHIYNRWGHEIFVTHNLYQGWDGSEHGVILDSDTYVYIIRFRNQNGEMRDKRGFVNLIR